MWNTDLLDIQLIAQTLGNEWDREQYFKSKAQMGELREMLHCHCRIGPVPSGRQLCSPPVADSHQHQPRS